MLKKKSVFDDLVFDEDFFKEDNLLYKYCMKCGEKVKASAKYCCECGTSMFCDSLEEYNQSKNYKYCKKCGEENPKKANQCFVCGHKEFFDSLVEMKIASDKMVFDGDLLNNDLDLNNNSHVKNNLAIDRDNYDAEENRKKALKKAAEEKKKQDAIKKAEDEKKRQEEIAKNSGVSEYNESFKHRKNQDFAKEIECLKKAAEKGHTYAMYNLGVYYRGGKNVPKDREVARSYFAKGALKQNPCCEYLLGILNEEDGVREVAYRYFKLSADHGHPFACSKVYNYHRYPSKTSSWNPEGGEKLGVEYLEKGSQMVMVNEMSFLKNGPDLCKRELGFYYYNKSKNPLYMSIAKKNLLEKALSYYEMITTKDANDEKMIKEIKKLLK